MNSDAVLMSRARLVCKENAQYRCAFCGAPGSEVHHQVSRRHKALKYDQRNLVFLCRGCHDHTEPRKMWHYFKDIRPDDCRYLLEQHPLAERWFR